MTDFTYRYAPTPWPDEATVERVATALADAYPDAGSDPTSDVFTDLARAALSVVPDPTGDTVLLDKVRVSVDGLIAETRAIVKAHGSDEYLAGRTDALVAVAALLAGGGE